MMLLYIYYINVIYIGLQFTYWTDKGIWKDFKVLDAGRSLALELQAPEEISDSQTSPLATQSKKFSTAQDEIAWEMPQNHLKSTI